MSRPKVKPVSLEQVDQKKIKLSLNKNKEGFVDISYDDGPFVFAIHHVRTNFGIQVSKFDNRKLYIGITINDDISQKIADMLKKIENVIWEQRTQFHPSFAKYKDENRELFDFLHSFVKEGNEMSEEQKAKYKDSKKDRFDDMISGDVPCIVKGDQHILDPHLCQLVTEDKAPYNWNSVVPKTRFQTVYVQITHISIKEKDFYPRICMRKLVPKTDVKKVEYDFDDDDYQVPLRPVTGSSSSAPAQNPLTDRKRALPKPGNVPVESEPSKKKARTLG